MMKTKEVIVLAFVNKTSLTPLLLTYDNESTYLHIDPQGCALFGADMTEPFYRLQEPLLLAHGIMTDPKSIHLVVLKTNGELCYTLISDTSTPQTTLIAKLDVRSLRYRRLFLFPQGKNIHIFYAHTHQALRDLWRIEHRYWDGSTWHSAHMGEVVHPREPFYHVNLDSQGNLHLLTVTFQGQHSLLFTNRFNAMFHIWGSPTETLKLSGEVVDMAALMTSDNVHHLYWVVKASNGQFEIRWAHQTDAHELASTWHLSPAPIKTFNPPWKGIGALENNGVVWLLAHTGEEVLMQNDGKGWKLISSHTPFHQALTWVHKGKRNSHQTYWLEDQAERRIPAYHCELGFTPKKQTVPETFHLTSTSAIFPTPSPIPAFYPDLTAPSSNRVPSLVVHNNSTMPPEEILQLEPLQDNNELYRLVSTVARLEEENAELHRLVSTVARLEEENAELLSLVSTVARLEEDNKNLSHILQNSFARYDQFFEVISENTLQTKQEVALSIAKIPFEELATVKEATSNLEKETQSLSQILRVMLGKQEQNDSSLETLKTQLCQLQTEKENDKKEGFWSKWIT